MAQQPNDRTKHRTGRCLCSKVRYQVTGSLRAVAICHCRQCARWTGSNVAATSVANDHFELLAGHNDLSWYASSPEAERGFCRNCGSSLFWRPLGGKRISIMAGTLDQPTGLTVAAEIFVSEKSDYEHSRQSALHFDQAPDPSVLAVPDGGED